MPVSQGSAGGAGPGGRGRGSFQCGGQRRILIALPSLLQPSNRRRNPPLNFDSIFRGQRPAAVANRSALQAGSYFAALKRTRFNVLLLNPQRKEFSKRRLRSSSPASKVPHLSEGHLLPVITEPCIQIGANNVSSGRGRPRRAGTRRGRFTVGVL